MAFAFRLRHDAEIDLKGNWFDWAEPVGIDYTGAGLSFQDCRNAA